MRAVWMRCGADMRSRGRPFVGIVLILGLLGGAAIAAAAGARRTTTAYPRFLERHDDFDLTVTFPDREAGFRAIEWIRARPDVSSVAVGTGFSGSVTVDGNRVSFPSVLLFVRLDSEPHALPGGRVVAGRMFDPENPREMLVNYAFAERYGIAPGDFIEVSSSSGFGLLDASPERSEGSFEVVGIFVRIGSLESATTRGFPMSTFFTPAFFRSMNQGDFELDADVKLRSGAEGVDALLADLRAAGFEPDQADTPDSFTEGVQGLNRVPATALWIAAGLLAFLAVALTVQALVREAHVSGSETPALVALGFTRRQRYAVECLRVVATVVGGAAVAAAVAYLLSPMTPVALARVVEPDPGFRFDATAILLGVGVIVLAVPVASSLWLWRAVGARPADVAVVARSAVAEALARAHAAPSVVTGVRLALGSGRGLGHVPVRAAVLGATLAVAALVAALTFVGSLDRLVAEPALSGYTWDIAAMVAGNADDGLERVSAAPEVERAWKGMAFSTVSLARSGGDPLVVSAAVSEGPLPPPIRGRAPVGADEIALDTRTTRDLRVEIGDVVSVDAGEGELVRFTLVGTLPVATFPFIGTNAGQGVSLTADGLRRVQPDLVWEAVFATLRPGLDKRAAFSSIQDHLRGHVFAAISSDQATTVRNVGRLAGIPPLLASLMAVLGAATLAHGLITTIRRRRRDLAILKTIGFVRRQIGSAVAWQASTLTVIALAIGIPAGVAGGRWGWRAFADYLAVASVPVTPVLVPVVVAGGALVVANVIAALPGRAASRTQASHALRAE